MRKEAQFFLEAKPEVKQFVREQPHWYRLLARNPGYIYEIEQHAKQHYGHTFPQRIDKLNQQLQMASMFMNMMMAMGQSTE